MMTLAAFSQTQFLRQLDHHTLLETELLNYIRPMEPVMIMLPSKVSRFHLRLNYPVADKVVSICQPINCFAFVPKHGLDSTKFCGMQPRIIGINVLTK